MSTDASHDEMASGHAIYSSRTLRLYDLVVLRVSNPLIWKCPTRRLEALYAAHATANHLDVGVGTGYFLDHCPFPSASPRIALMDLNEDALAFAAARIARFGPETYRRNVLEPIRFAGERFDSVGVNYLLHCLPGSLTQKSAVFDHLRALMNPGAVLFGSTLLQGGVTRSWWARRLMAAYNAHGIFSNCADDLDTLRQALGERFRSVTVEAVGCAALFSGRL